MIKNKFKSLLSAIPRPKSEDLLLFFSETKSKILDNWKGSLFVVPVESNSSLLQQNSVSIQVVSIKKTTFAKEITIDKKDSFDPFAPPYEDGFLLIRDLNGTHHVVYNKFALFPGHCVLFTIEFQSQYTHLTVDG